MFVLSALMLRRADVANLLRLCLKYIKADCVLINNLRLFTVHPGEKYREIGNVVQKHAQSHGFSVVRSYCGHGIHGLFHTAPSIPHYASRFRLENEVLASSVLCLSSCVV